jgi:hypothetical protein
MRTERWCLTARLRMRSLLRSRQVEEEDEELRFHLENKIEEGISRGLSARSAQGGPIGPA